MSSNSKPTRVDKKLSFKLSRRSDVFLTIDFAIETAPASVIQVVAKFRSVRESLLGNVSEKITAMVSERRFFERSREFNTRLLKINFFREGPMLESKLFDDKFNVVTVEFPLRVVRRVLTPSEPILLFDKSNEMMPHPLDIEDERVRQAGVEIEHEFKFK